MGDNAGFTPELPSRRTSSPPAGRGCCAHCGAPVDPLRASRVAFFGERFRYFCSPGCRDDFDPEAHVTPVPAAWRRSGALRPEHIVASRSNEKLFDLRRQTAEALADVGGDELTELEQHPATPPETLPIVTEPAKAGTHDPSRGQSSSVPDVSALLLALAVLGGVLAVGLVLAGSTPAVVVARLVVAIVACGALTAEGLTGRRDPTEPSPLALLAAPILALGTALAARAVHSSSTEAAISLTGLVAAATAGGSWLMRRARQDIDAERARIAAIMDISATRVVGDEVSSVAAGDLRPGEEIVIGPDEFVPVDVTVTAGTAKVLPWLGSTTTLTRSEGESIVAGARILEGTIRAVVGFTLWDRAWMRLTNDPRGRADLVAPLARFGRLTAERGAPLAAGLAALTAFAQNQPLPMIAMSAIAGQAALANAGIAHLGALHVARAVLDTLRRGIAFRTAESLDRAGRVSAATFLARGTLLLGEPEVANVEPIGDQQGAERVLALVAGAEGGAADPVASAILRAARTRGVRPDGVRSPTFHPGLGVTAVASNGQPLVVGSRALMLKERISVARAEPKITELEAMGRTVTLVALGGRLMGAIGLQDGLRPGARAAVQHLLDVGVEPVLLSGDARETCEAWGRALDIEHIRPEVLPGERGNEIRQLADGGAVVAVVGRSPLDDAALSAADVSVALGTAGSTSAEWHVQLASDEVRDAALALRFAHACRAEAKLGLILTSAPAVAGALAVAFGLAAPALAPVAAFAGTVAGLLRFRSGHA